MAHRYPTIGLGGTFDHLHKGHEHFLKYANDLAETVLIGITADDLVKNKPWAHLIEDYDTRYRTVKTFCRENRIQARIVQLHDAVGPTLEKGMVQALCVTPETEAGADHINTLRLKLKMRPLQTYVSTYFLAETGEPLHSASIRQGRLNQNGQNWWKPLETTLELTDTQRSFFQNPQGPITNKLFPTATFTAVVGDFCLEYFRQRKWSYQIGVFDLKTQRIDHKSAEILKIADDANTHHVTNAPGLISLELTRILQEIIPSRYTLRWQEHIHVDGEEDLAAVALALLLPLGSTIYYGQRDVGMVAMAVTIEKKNEILELFSKPSPKL